MMKSALEIGLVEFELTVEDLDCLAELVLTSSFNNQIWPKFMDFLSWLRKGYYQKFGSMAGSNQSKELLHSRIVLFTNLCRYLEGNFSRFSLFSSQLKVVINKIDAAITRGNIESGLSDIDRRAMISGLTVNLMLRRLTEYIESTDWNDDDLNRQLREILLFLLNNFPSD